jgi:methionyl-tRNA formyltransferase
MSIVFVGTPEFAVPSLRRLFEAGYDISAVVTQPDRAAGRGRQTRQPPIKRLAQELGLRVMQPASLRDPEALHQVAALQPEVIVAVAYGQILRQEFLDIAPRGVLNVHPSLLPRHRGASPIAAAILAGEETTGVTVMLMDAGMDSGPLLARQEDTIYPYDTAATLSARLSEAGAQLLVATLPAWLAGTIEPQPQDPSQATVTRLLKKEDGLIDWSRSAVDIWRQVRACNPWPGAHTRLDGALLHIWQAWPLPGTADGAPGWVVALPAEQASTFPAEDAEPAFAVATGDGLLVPLELQREGRKRLPAQEFLRGAPALIGRQLTANG